VNNLETYIIPFSGLKAGAHQFTFRIDKSFFEHFEYSQVADGQVDVTVDLEKEERMLVFYFTISGTVILPCDRCNDPMELEISGKEQLVVKLGDHFEEESEVVVIIPEAENKVDLGPYIYEYIHLMLPIRRVHPGDTEEESRCNPDVLKKLKELSEQHNPDPRWEALNKLRDKS
jgi:uncharacterized metal-binding protein YceD (DUF177 family)